MRARKAVLTHGRRSWEFVSRSPTGAAHDFVLRGVTGWYGGVAVRTSTTPRLGHGSFEQRAFRGDRALTLTGSRRTQDPDEREAIERDFSGVLGDGTFGELTVTTDIELTTRVRLDGEVSVLESGHRTLVLQLPLHAPDPFLYGPEQVTYLHPIGTGVGLQYPLYGPTVAPGGQPVLSYGTAIDSQDPVSNPGNADAWPSYVVVGDFPSGFQIRVADKVVRWPHPVAPQAPVQVDMSGSIWVGQQNQTDRATLRQWSPVPAGSSVHPVFEPLQFGSGWCEVHLRPTYL